MTRVSTRCGRNFGRFPLAGDLLGLVVNVGYAWIGLTKTGLICVLLASPEAWTSLLATKHPVLNNVFGRFRAGWQGSDARDVSLVAIQQDSCQLNPFGFTLGLLASSRMVEAC